MRKIIFTILILFGNFLVSFAQLSNYVVINSSKYTLHDSDIYICIGKSRVLWNVPNDSLEKYDACTCIRDTLLKIDSVQIKDLNSLSGFKTIRNTITCKLSNSSIGGDLIKVRAIKDSLSGIYLIDIASESQGHIKKYIFINYSNDTISCSLDKYVNDTPTTTLRSGVAINSCVVIPLDPPSGNIVTGNEVMNFHFGINSGSIPLYFRQIRDLNYNSELDGQNIIGIEMSNSINIELKDF